MTADIENLVLEHLRAIRATLGEHGERLSHIEVQLWRWANKSPDWRRPSMPDVRRWTASSAANVAAKRPARRLDHAKPDFPRHTL